MKNIVSKEIILKIPIEQMNITAIKFIEAIPVKGVFVGIIGMGPDTKNLAKLYVPEAALIRKENMGNPANDLG